MPDLPRDGDRAPPDWGSTQAGWPVRSQDVARSPSSFPPPPGARGTEQTGQTLAPGYGPPYVPPGWGAPPYLAPGGPYGAPTLPPSWGQPMLPGGFPPYAGASRPRKRWVVPLVIGGALVLVLALFAVAVPTFLATERNDAGRTWFQNGVPASWSPGNVKGLNANETLEAA